MALEELSLVINNPTKGEFLQTIGWNKEEFMKLVASITKQYEGLTYTEEQMKDAKADRAKLNAMKKAVSDKRIEVKKAVMAPYNQFEKEVNEVVALIEKPIELIDGQIKEYEERLRTEKRKTLNDYFNEISEDLEVSFDKIFEQKWLNASLSLKKAKEEIADKITKIRINIDSIETLCDERHRPQLKDYYMRCLNITATIAESSRLKEIDRKEAERKKCEAELKARQEEAGNKERESEEKKIKAAPKPLAPVQIPVGEIQKPVEGAVATPSENTEVTEPSQEDTKQYKASFTIYGTKAEIMAVKQYMIDNNIKFGKVEK